MKIATGWILMLLNLMVITMDCLLLYAGQASMMTLVTFLLSVSVVWAIGWHLWKGIPL